MRPQLPKTSVFLFYHGTNKRRLFKWKAFTLFPVCQSMKRGEKRTEFNENYIGHLLRFLKYRCFLSLYWIFVRLILSKLILSVDWYSSGRSPGFNFTMLGVSESRKHLDICFLRLLPCAFLCRWVANSSSEIELQNCFLRIIDSWLNPLLRFPLFGILYP